ncbi:MAG: M15 family metallopeptidase [Clostridia bacterium]|nr:M15 family metallopeptidase [Clostridia bacterium]
MSYFKKLLYNIGLFVSRNGLLITASAAALTAFSLLAAILSINAQKADQSLFIPEPQNQIISTSTVSSLTSSELNTTTHTTTAPKIGYNVAAQPDNDNVFVKVTDYIPTIHIELKYATTDNISGKVIYDFTDAYLRYGTVKKLAKVQEQLLTQGCSLKIWDAYRPPYAQFVLWEAYPNAKYVANPYSGYSSHSRGGCVDVTLVTASGEDIEMPTGFDDFSSRADRDYSDVTSGAKSNALLLENTMKDNGFKPYFSEWWHFNDTVTYDIEEQFIP